MIIKSGFVFINKEDKCNSCLKNSQGCALQYFLTAHKADMVIDIKECKENEKVYSDAKV